MVSYGIWPRALVDRHVGAYPGKNICLCGGVGVALGVVVCCIALSCQCCDYAMLCDDADCYCHCCVIYDIMMFCGF